MSVSAPAETQVQTQDQVPVQAQVEDQIEAEFEAQVETEVEPKVEPEAEAEIEAQLETEVETKVETKVEPKVEVEIEAEVEPKVEAVVDAEVEPKVETEIAAEVQGQMEIEVQSGFEAELESRLESLDMAETVEDDHSYEMESSWPMRQSTVDERVIDQYVIETYPQPSGTVEEEPAELRSQTLVAAQTDAAADEVLISASWNTSDNAESLEAQFTAALQDDSGTLDADMVNRSFEQMTQGTKPRLLEISVLVFFLFGEAPKPLE